MNDKSNIKNSIYRFNFSLAKITGDTNKNVYIPLPKGIVRYLEIDDNLANMGYVGTVIFNNFYGILDKLGLGAGISDFTTLFDINIENLDFQGSNIQDNSIQALFILQNNTDPSNNTIDKSIIYNFEEYSISLLRQKKSEPKTVSGKITDSIYSILANCFKGDAIIDKDSFTALAGSSNEMSVDSSILKTNSFYDFLKVLYKYLLLSGNNNSPGLLQLENFIEKNIEGDRVVRKFVIRPLFDKIRSLIEKINRGDNNLTEEVLERFSIGGESRRPSYRENSIETLTILRPDFRTLYESKWVNYTGVTTLQNLTDVISLNIKYENLRKGFQRDALVNTESNLPARVDINSVDTLEKVLAFDYPIVNDNNLLEQGITSMIYKSFIYDNTAVVFKTLGNPYRKPGSFVFLDGGTENDKNASVTGYWFVIGIKHIFENEIYTNEITAVKIFIEADKTPKAFDNNTTVDTTTSGFINPPTGTNTSDFVEPNSTTFSSTLNDTQLPTLSEEGYDGASNSLLPDISNGEPVIDSAPNTQPVTNTPAANTSDFTNPNSTNSPSNLNDDQLPTPSPEGYDGPSDSLFITPEGIPFAPDADQSSSGTSSGLSRIEQSRRESPFSIVKVGGVDPAASARIAEQRALRNAILGRS